MPTPRRAGRLAGRVRAPPPPPPPPPPRAAAGRVCWAPSLPTPYKAACPSSLGPDMTGTAAAPAQATSAGQRPEERPRGFSSPPGAARVFKRWAEQGRKEMVAERGARAQGSHLSRGMGAGWLVRSRRPASRLLSKDASGLDDLGSSNGCRLTRSARRRRVGLPPPGAGPGPPGTASVPRS